MLSNLPLGLASELQNRQKPRFLAGAEHEGFAPKG